MEVSRARAIAASSAAVKARRAEDDQAGENFGEHGNEHRGHLHNHATGRAEEKDKYHASACSAPRASGRADRRDTGGFGGIGGFAALAFSPTGKQVVVGGANAELKVLDIASRKQVGAALRSYGWYYTSAIFSPDGKYIATADNAGQLGLWNAANHHRVAANIAKGSNQLGQIAFSPNSELLAAAVNDDVRIWNARSFKNPMVLDAGKGGAAGLSFSPDGKILATASTGGIIKFWNTSNGRLADAPLTATNDGVSEIADSPNGSILADAENDGTIQLWNPSTRSQVGPFPAGAPKDYEASSVVITALVFNLAGTLLATAGADGTARF